LGPPVGPAWYGLPSPHLKAVTLPD